MKYFLSALRFFSILNLCMLQAMYYNVLEIPSTADQHQIRRAYKSLALKKHPDKGGSEEDFKQLSTAYEVLSSPRRRARYDQYTNLMEPMPTSHEEPIPQEHVTSEALSSEFGAFNECLNSILVSPLIKADFEKVRIETSPWLESGREEYFKALNIFASNPRWLAGRGKIFGDALPGFDPIQECILNNASQFLTADPGRWDKNVRITARIAAARLNQMYPKSQQQPLISELPQYRTFKDTIDHAIAKSNLADPMARKRVLTQLRFLVEKPELFASRMMRPSLPEPLETAIIRTYGETSWHTADAAQVIIERINARYPTMEF